MNWLKTTVGEFCSFIYGKSIKKDDQVDRGIPVYGSNGIYTYAEKKLAGAHSVIIGRKGSVGKVHISNTPCWVSDTAFYVENKSLEEAYFTYYLLSSLGLEDMNTDAAVPGLNRNNAHRLEIEIPESEIERKHLIQPLINLDEKIQLNHQINQTLEQIAQALFKSWFVDFDPVKAKIEVLEAGGSEEEALLAAMQVISSKNAEELAAFEVEKPEEYAQLRATAELFPAAMVESELGEVPEGWSVDSLQRKIEVLNGFAFKSTDYVKKPGVFVLRTKNFNDFGVAERLLDDVYLPEVFNESHERYLCEGYDYHLVMVGASVGKRGIIYPSDLPALRNQNMWCFRPVKTSRVGRAFTKYMLDDLVSKKIGLASGSARAFFRKGDFQKQKICFATDLIQDKFHETVFPLLEKQAENIAENNNLTSLRDTLLPKLLSGELDVSKLAESIGADA